MSRIVCVVILLLLAPLCALAQEQPAMPDTCHQDLRAQLEAYSRCQQVVGDAPGAQFRGLKELRLDVHAELQKKDTELRTLQKQLSDLKQGRCPETTPGPSEPLPEGAQP